MTYASEGSITSSPSLLRYLYGISPPAHPPCSTSCIFPDMNWIWIFSRSISATANRIAKVNLPPMDIQWRWPCSPSGSGSPWPGDRIQMTASFPTSKKNRSPESSSPGLLGRFTTYRNTSPRNLPVHYCNNPTIHPVFYR